MIHHLLQYSFLILSLFSFTIQSQKRNIEYLYDQNQTYTNTTIASSTDFLPLEKDINNGLKTGIYWFKIAPENVSEKKLTINNTHILQGEIYTKKTNKCILPLKKEPYLSFSIPKVSQPIYLKVIADREAYIPIRIINEESFLNKKFGRKFVKGAYYGFTCMLILLNLFYFINFKEKTFLAHICYLISVNIALLFSDGSFNVFFENTDFFKNAELINRCFVAILGYYFASVYLELDFYKSKHKRVSIPLFLLLIPLLICYFVLNTFIFHVLIEVVVFTIQGIYLTYAFLMYKKSDFAKYFCWAFSLLFLVSLAYFIGRDLGVNLANIKPVHLKLGGTIEMLFVSYAIVYRMQILQKENQLMRNAIFEFITKINDLKHIENHKIIKIDKENFSDKELVIIDAISKGLSNQQISENMFISINTVKYYTKKIYNKLKIDSRRGIQEKTIMIN